jgi:hypothetical protein
MAERVGFDRTRAFTLPVFKTGAVNRLATSPHYEIKHLEPISGRAYQATLELIKQIQKMDPKHQRTSGARVWGCAEVPSDVEG